jgi:hypothetical protein
LLFLLPTVGMQDPFFPVALFILNTRRLCIS